MSKCISILTTFQTPHFEDMLNVEKYQIGYEKYIVLDVASGSPIRIDLSFHDSFINKISKFYRNNILKKIFGNEKKIQVLFKNCTSNKITIDFDTLIGLYQSFIYKKKSSCNVNFSSSDIKKFIELSKYVDRILQYIIDNYSPNDTFIIFNGRLPLEFLIKKKLIESGYKNIKNLETNEYVNNLIIRDSDIHDLKSYSKEAVDFLCTYSNDYIDNLFAKTSLRLSNNFEKNKSNNKTINTILIFTSSFDEHVFYYDKTVNQQMIIRYLLENLSIKYNIIIRIHPLTANKDISDKLLWYKLYLDYPSNVILWYDHRSSFELIDESEYVITFGSSLSAYCGAINKNILVVGSQNIYVDMNIIPVVSEEEIINSISDQTGFNNFISLFNKSINNRLCRAVFLYEKHMGYPRVHKLIGKNIHSTEIIFKKDYIKYENFKILFNNYDDICLYIKMINDYVLKNINYIKLNFGNFFKFNIVDNGQLSITFSSSSNDKFKSFDTVSNLIDLYQDFNFNPNIRSIPISLNKEIDIHFKLFLAYQVLIGKSKFGPKSEFSEPISNCIDEIN